MIKQSDGDVLIVGAGPGGLTLANDLAVRGIPFRVIDPLLREYFGGRLVRELDMGAVRRDPYPVMLMIFQQRVLPVLETVLIERVPSRRVVNRIHIVSDGH